MQHDEPLNFEIIPTQAESSFRWFRHDYPHPSAHWHIHPEYEIHLITHGEGTAYIGDYIGPFKAGTLMMTGPNLPHNWVSDISSDAHQFDRDLVLQFNGQLIEQLGQCFSEATDLHQLLKDATQGLEFIGQTAINAAEQLTQLGQAEGSMKVAGFIELLSTLRHSDERVSLASGQYLDNKNQQDLKVLNGVIAFLYRHYPNDISQKAVAQQAGMSESSFSRFFKRNTGYNFTYYLNKIRINQAAIQLINTQRPISQLCYDVGFNNLSNFNRMFLKQKDMTPSAFRQKHQRC
ncbi:MAG: AraC family transcriptional regulator [Pontibacterium sp.]